MKLSVYLAYLLVMAVVTYLVRAVPFVLIRQKIKSRFIRSFLSYIPYAVLSAMTFPAIFYSTGSTPNAVAATIAAVVAAFFGANLPICAVIACVLSYVLSFLI